MNFAISIFRHIPILGWLIADAQKGTDMSKILFFVNLIVIWMLAMFFFGYAAFIFGALALVALIFLALLSVTVQDGF